jgi:hypothetical protein
MSVDVIARPSRAGLAYRAEQLERDRLRLLEQLEREELDAHPRLPPRHPRTGRFLAHDCEVDCLVHCAGLCGSAP